MITIIKYIIASISLFFLCHFFLTPFTNEIATECISFLIPTMVMCTGIIVYHIKKEKEDKK